MEPQRGRDIPARVVSSPSWNNYLQNDSHRNNRFRGDHQYRNSGNNSRGDRSRNSSNNNNFFKSKGNCSFRLRATLSMGDTPGSPPHPRLQQLEREDTPKQQRVCVSYPGVHQFPDVGVLGAPHMPVFQVHAPQPVDAANSFQTLSVTPSPLGHGAFPDPVVAPGAGGLGTEFRRTSPDDDGYRLMVTLPVGWRPDGTYGVLEAFDPFQSYRMAPYYINPYTYHSHAETLNNADLVPYNTLM